MVGHAYSVEEFEEVNGTKVARLGAGNPHSMLFSEPFGGHES